MSDYVEPDWVFEAMTIPTVVNPKHVPSEEAISAAKFFGVPYERWTAIRRYWELRSIGGERTPFCRPYVRGGGDAIPQGVVVSSWFWTRDEYPLDISISPENDARKARLVAADIYGIG